MNTPRAMVALALLIALALPAAAGGEEPEAPALSLVHPGSLAGWDYGEYPPRGWTTAEGALSGSEGSTKLVSGWAFGDFELRFDCALQAGSVLELSLPRVPQGEGPVLTIRQEDKPGKPRAARLARSGGKLTLEVDGADDTVIDVPPAARYGFGLAFAKGGGAIRNLRLREPGGEPIFNGRDLTGWWTPGNLKSWPIEDGQIVCINKGGNYLRTEKEYGNFTLALDFKMRQGGNSGIGIRTPRRGWPSGDGIELQLLDQRPDAKLTGSSMMAFYRNLPPLARADRSEEWNHVVIKCEGYVITAWVNGVLCQHSNTARLPELMHRNLQGWIGFQDHGAWVRLKNLRLEEAPEGRGLEAWYRPRPESAPELVLHRLMNYERLSKDHGLRSGAAAKAVETDEDTLVADLQGPGALVRCYASAPQGKLAFYFDGEKAPRFEAPAGQLRGRLPRVADDQNPVLTCLTYAERLKVVARGAKGAAFRLDYVTLPSSAPLEPPTDSEDGFPRGLLAAIDYRHAHHRYGTHREHDPRPREHSGVQNIPPRKAVPLISLEEGGIVHWTKLRGGKQLLQNDDLWLQVVVDGESEPAIFAPARYLFPGLVDAGNFHNFVVLNRGGFTNRLAMPYGDGLQIFAVNRGDEPVGGVGVTVSYEPASWLQEGDVATRMRLRGIYQEAGGKTWAERQGTGRWVGLIYESPQEGPDTLGTLAVDGHPLSGWGSVGADAFLGANAKESDFRKCLSGRYQGLAWRWLLLAPVDFQKSLRLEAPDRQSAAARLALFYMKK